MGKIAGVCVNTSGALIRYEIIWIKVLTKNWNVAVLDSKEGRKEGQLIRNYHIKCIYMLGCDTCMTSQKTQNKTFHSVKNRRDTLSQEIPIFRMIGDAKTAKTNKNKRRGIAKIRLSSVSAHIGPNHVILRYVFALST